MSTRFTLVQYFALDPNISDDAAEEEIVLIDVREESEWNDKHITEAKHIYVGHLAKVASSLPKNRLLPTICTWGGRGGLGASILKNEGFEVYNVLGGMNAWRNLGYHIEEGE